MSTVERRGISESRIEQGSTTTTEPGAILMRWPALEDPAPAQRMRIQESAGGIQFWHDPEEDIYGPEDGEPA